MLASGQTTNYILFKTSS